MRSVLVTGASKGIGAAIAVRLGRDGFAIAVHYRNDEEGARAALEADIAQHGAYYGVVSNAGIHRDNVFPALTGEDWDAVLRTDLDGFYNVLQPCVMPMIQAHRGGRVVVLSSVAGVLGNRGQVNYSAAKAGLIGAAKALALELAKRQITVNCVAPGLIETGMAAGPELESIAKAIPVRRIGRPEEVAELVAYLFSDLAAYVTRQVIRIDGGLS